MEGESSRATAEDEPGDTDDSGDDLADFYWQEARETGAHQASQNDIGNAELDGALVILEL
ncbi:hypothetical protein ACFSKW_52125 [Nonomuraea mangrovi]|uniref:Uncharacterized protein n=1 Tax=Nonomuraea mangrovi TaxID=2316207 RepID=A0ABW4TE88_9ACTN